jgi:adenylate cyclase
MRAPLLNNDAARVAALHRYGILDSAPEPAYEEISKLAAQICDCPVATIGFIDDRRHWAKSRCGLPRDEKPRELSICNSTVCQSDLLLVPDLAADERFSGYSTVAGKPHFRFYCGMPLINPEGFALGTLCVMDFQPRQLSFAQTEAVRCLAHQVSTQLELRRKLLELEEAHRQIELERAEGERLLANILPKEIADELRHEGRVKPRYYQAVTILFSDFVGFTKLAEMLEPNELIAQLDDYFSAFDRIVERHRLEKIKTIGDAYMAVGGLPVPNHTHPYDAALASIEISHHAEKVNRQRENLRLSRWDLRIGIHTGPVIAGVVGSNKFTYDVWGDAVNIAARFVSGGRPGKVCISEYAYNLIREGFEASPAGQIEAKNKGMLTAFFLERIKPEFSQDPHGIGRTGSLNSSST